MMFTAGRHAFSGGTKSSGALVEFSNPNLIAIAIDYSQVRPIPVLVGLRRSAPLQRVGNRHRVRRHALAVASADVYRARSAPVCFSHSSHRPHVEVLLRVVTAQFRV